ncbi:hypothetical protein H0H92_001845 [Tricholoma furcatifolium]|nr:hypothetical protein H0H92_001845 [Tricholoma furcatifolium]
MRPLTLHASALNDNEYELYTTSLRNLNDDASTGAHDDAYYEAMRIGVREILRLFAPALANTDILTGGQFFAALRLVVHAEQGRDIDRSLAFVQAHPAPPKVTPVVSPHSSHNPFVSSRVPPLPPRKQPSFPQPSVLFPPPRTSTSPTRPPPPPPPHHPPVPPKPAHVTSTLMKQSLMASKAGQTMKQAEAQLEKERVLQVLKSSAVVSGPSIRSSTNNNQGNSVKDISPSMSSNESAEGRAGKAPPLPRRRNTHSQQPSPPMSVSSIEQVALARTPSDPSQAPPPPPARSSTNSFPPAQSSATSGSNNPYRRPSTPSYGSYTSPQSSPSRGTTDLPPPTHPDRLPPQPTTPSHPTESSPFRTPATNDSEGSPTTRVFRSKSLHHPSPPPIPLPTAPPRRRPESVQLTSPDKDGPTSLSRHSSFSNSAMNRGPHKRQVSMSASFSSMSASFSSLGLGDKERQERELEEQERDRESPLGKFARSWQPRLEKARYKAEAGLSRRGFVRGDHESGWIKGPEETEDLLESDCSPFDDETKRWRGRGMEYDYDPPSVDTASDDSSPTRRERDILKWPVEEGWRRL